METEDIIKEKKVFRLTLPFEDYESICVSAEINLEYQVSISQPLTLNEAARVVTFEITFRQVHVRNASQMFASFLIRTFKAKK